MPILRSRSPGFAGRVALGGLALVLGLTALGDAHHRIKPDVDFGELQHLVAKHPPQEKRKTPAEADVEKMIELVPGGPAVRFVIPGFSAYGCPECHSGETLLDDAIRRMRLVMQDFKDSPSEIPLKQYLIQPYHDELLRANQFAHATFDTIRVFPRTVIVDEHVYANATHQHETLHLGQTFLGFANELEAYALNVRADPRFLIAEFPFFQDVVQLFFVDDFKSILDRYFLRPVQEQSPIPREVQWFLIPFEAETLDRLEVAIEAMEPLLREAGRLNREYPFRLAYLSDRLGIPSLALELAAIQLLDLPPIQSGESLRNKVFEALDVQWKKDDNTRLGYRIDRKKEGLMMAKYQLKITDGQERLRLYFHFLKRKFILPDGTLDWSLARGEDFRNYMTRMLTKEQKFVEGAELTPIEKNSARQWIEQIKKELPSETDVSVSEGVQ